MLKKGTICWTCALNAGRCPWSACFRPVSGWKARRRVFTDSDGSKVCSYTVRLCPLYKNVPIRFFFERGATAAGEEK